MHRRLKVTGLNLANFACFVTSGFLKRNPGTEPGIAFRVILKLLRFLLLQGLVLDHEVHAAVLLTAFLGGVVGDRHGHTETLGRESIFSDTLFHEECLHVIGTLLGKLHVVFFGTGVVGVTFNGYVELLVHGKNTGHLGKARLEVCLEVCLVDGEQAGLEIKTAGVSQYELWKGDEVPDAYYAQCQHYMLVTGFPMWYIAVLIGGNEGIIKEVPRNEDFIAMLFEAEQEFWKSVEERTMPDVDGMKSTSEALAEMYPQAKADSVLQLPSTDELEKIFADYERYDAIIEDSKLLKTECENRLKVLMGDNEVCIVGDGDTQHKITWKNVKGRTTIDGKKLQKEMPDVYEQYKKVGAPSRRFEIKNKKEKEK